MPVPLHTFPTLSVWLAQSASKWHAGALITALLWHVSHATAISCNQSHSSRVLLEFIRQMKSSKENPRALQLLQQKKKGGTGLGMSQRWHWNHCLDKQLGFVEETLSCWHWKQTAIREMSSASLKDPGSILSPFWMWWKANWTPNSPLSALVSDLAAFWGSGVKDTSRNTTPPQSTHSPDNASNTQISCSEAQKKGWGLNCP